MAKVFSEISPELHDWVRRQHIFFVATAPLTSAGHVNCSPKGGDTFRVLGPTEVVYQDYTGSGAETVAHLRENGRIVIMFCAFEGGPRIVRFHGRGQVVAENDPRFAELGALFPPHLGTRAFILVNLTRISDSCGYSIPFYDYRAHRDTLDRWCENKGVEKVVAYRSENNRVSLDGLPAFDGEES
jgi:hypothetical protein